MEVSSLNLSLHWYNAKENKRQVWFLSLKESMLPFCFCFFFQVLYAGNFENKELVSTNNEHEVNDKKLLKTNNQKVNASQVKCSDSTDWNETHNPLITSQMLNPLSCEDSHGEPSHWLSSCLFLLHIHLTSAPLICPIVIYHYMVPFLIRFYMEDYNLIWSYRKKVFLKLNAEK